MEEHAAQPCSKRCALSALRGKTLDFAGIALGSDSGIAHFEDLVRGDVLGHLCGQAEPHDHLFTQQHEYVVIDNELMFAGNPCIEQCRWLSNKDAHPLIAQVCLGLVGIRDDKLGEMAAVPGGYIVSTALNLYDQLLWAKAAALKYIKNFKTPFSALSLRL